MGFLGKKNASASKKNAGVKSGVTVGSLFNPNIGATLRPLGETGRMLVTLIAAIFASNGLFPRNHPALHNVPGARITLAEVLGIGWQNVTFTREAMPRTLIYFAVVLSLGLSIFAILIGILHAFMGTAHAQSCIGPTCFVAPGDPSGPFPGYDLAINWLNWLFLSDPFPIDPLASFTDPVTGASQSSAVGNTVGPGTGTDAIQGALINALGLYSYCMLVIGAIVLFYHLAAMVTETAHHGVVMGRRANQVWAPIRLVTAVGLLVPIGAIGFGTGLNSGQYIILEIAKWGTGLASNVWGMFLNTMATDNFNFVPPPTPYSRGAVTDTYLSGVCIEAYNQYAFYSGSTTAIPVAGTSNPMPDGSTKVTYTPVGPDFVAADNDLCGYYIIPALQLSNSGTYNPAGKTESTIIGNVQAGVDTAFTTMQAAVTTTGGINSEYFIPIADGGTGGGAPPYEQDLDPMVSQYMGDINAVFSSLSAGLGGAMAAVAFTSTEEGWASAGTWFNTIARLQGDLTDIPRDMMPRTAPPQVEVIVQENSASPLVLERETMNTMTGFQQWLYQSYGPNAPPVTPATVFGDGSADQQQIELASVGTLQQGNVSNSHFMDKIFEVIDIVASMNGVWHSAVSSTAGGCAGSSCFTLGVQFSTYNPIAEIAALGHANINTAYQLYDDYIELQGVASGARDAKNLFQIAGSATGAGFLAKFFATGAQVTSETAGAIGEMVGSAVVVFFTAGFLLAYFLPLIPFYRFFFATLSWFLSLFEALVAVPLIALAHLTPEGEGFMGEKAKTAYYFVFNIFLKPVLMVFGLATGYLMFCLAVSMMNLLYATAVSGAGGVSQGHFTLGRLIYSIIYVVIIYLCCNKCFQLIDWLPDHAIKWMGAQGLHHAQMGDPMEVGGYMASAGAVMENKIVQGTGKAMSGPMGAAALGLMASDKSPGGFAATLRGATQNLGSMLQKTAGNSLGMPNLGAGLETGLNTANNGASKAMGLLSQGAGAITGLTGDAGKAAHEAMDAHRQQNPGDGPTSFGTLKAGAVAAGAVLAKEAAAGAGHAVAAGGNAAQRVLSGGGGGSAGTPGGGNGGGGGGGGGTATGTGGAAAPQRGASLAPAASSAQTASASSGSGPRSGMFGMGTAAALGGGAAGIGGTAQMVANTLGGGDSDAPPPYAFQGTPNDSEDV